MNLLQRSEPPTKVPGESVVAFFPTRAEAEEDAYFRQGHIEVRDGGARWRSKGGRWLVVEVAA